MKYSKRLIAVSGIVGTIGIAGIGATALAATSSSNSSYSPLVQKLASTFGLDPAKVNDVFKQQHQDNMQNRETRIKSSLDQAVKDGKLTQDQETKLIAELKTLHDQFKNDKTQNRQNFKTQLDQWAKDNGITNLDQILPAPPAGLHRMGPGDGDTNGDSTNG
jgi:polyhydroxyalkanoate synthesis regulator phasin